MSENKWIKAIDRLPGDGLPKAAKYKGRYMELSVSEDGCINCEGMKFGNITILEEWHPGIEWLDESPSPQINAGEVGGNLLEKLKEARAAYIHCESSKSLKIIDDIIIQVEAGAEVGGKVLRFVKASIGKPPESDKELAIRIDGVRYLGSKFMDDQFWVIRQSYGAWQPMAPLPYYRIEWLEETEPAALPIDTNEECRKQAQMDGFDDWCSIHKSPYFYKCPYCTGLLHYRSQELNKSEVPGEAVDIKEYGHKSPYEFLESSSSTIQAMIDYAHQEVMNSNLRNTARPIHPVFRGWDSRRLIGRSQERFNELILKGWDWSSFYNGWIEGRSDALGLMKEDYERRMAKPESLTGGLNVMDNNEGFEDDICKKCGNFFFHCDCYSPKEAVPVQQGEVPEELVKLANEIAEEVCPHDGYGVSRKEQEKSSNWLDFMEGAKCGAIAMYHRDQEQIKALQQERDQWKTQNEDARKDLLALTAQLSKKQDALDLIIQKSQVIKDNPNCRKILDIAEEAAK